MRRALPLALVALVAAGCGGSHSSLGGAAAYAPWNAEAFVSFRTNANWQPFARLVLGKVPRVPSTAHEAAFALVDGKIVPVRKTHVARSLADDDRYRAAIESVPRGARGIGYVRGDIASARLHTVPGLINTVNATRGRFSIPRSAHGKVPSVAVLQFRWAAASLTDEGVDERLRTSGLPRAETERVRALEELAPAFAPALFDEIPADAQLVLDLPLAPGSWEVLPHLPTPVARLFSGSLIGVAAELDQVMQGETALYTRKGGEVTLVTQPADTEAALKAVTELPPFQRFHQAVIGGQLVLSTSTAGIAVFRGGGPKLSTRLDLPHQVTSVVYSAGHWTGWTAAEGKDPTFTLRFSR